MLPVSHLKSLIIVTSRFVRSCTDHFPPLNTRPVKFWIQEWIQVAVKLFIKLVCCNDQLTCNTDMKSACVMLLVSVEIKVIIRENTA